jgi:hypothetical protein
MTLGEWEYISFETKEESQKKQLTKLGVRVSGCLLQWWHDDIPPET